MANNSYVRARPGARERQDGENVLALRLGYNVISTNVPGNNVLLDGVEQTVPT